MSLLSEQMDECIMINKVSVPDGYGGRSEVWTDSDFTFDAAVVINNSMESVRAQKEGVTSIYTITTSKNIVLQYHEVFRRIRDGKIFRVTSDGDDLYTPASAALDMRQVTAEEWSLPNG